MISTSKLNILTWPFRDLLIQSLYRFDQNLIPFPWSLNGWKRLIGDQGYILSMKFKGWKVCAVAFWRIEELGDCLHLLKIGVRPDCQRLGLGKHLLDQAKNSRYFKGKMILEVQAENDGAISFYEQYGFRKLHKQASYYSNGEAAWTMIYSARPASKG